MNKQSERREEKRMIAETLGMSERIHDCRSREWIRIKTRTKTRTVEAGIERVRRPWWEQNSDKTVER